MQKQARWEGVGCSDLPAIMKVSPYPQNTPYQTWKKKVYKLDDSADNPSTRYGKKMEPVIRGMVEERLGESFPPVQLFSKERPWFWATLDGYNPKTRTALEIKTASKDDHVGVVTGKIPDKYYPQVQGQGTFPGVERVIYASYYSNDLEILDMPQDPAYCVHLLEELDRFWHMVLTKTPPELTEKDFVDMEGNKEYGKILKDVGKIQKELEKTKISLKEHEDIKKALEEEESMMIDKLVSMAEGRNSTGYGYTIEQRPAKGRIDYSLIPELSEYEKDKELYDQYRKETSFKWTARYNGDR